MRVSKHNWIRVAIAAAIMFLAIGLAVQSVRSVELAARDAGAGPKLSSGAGPLEPFNMDDLTIPAEQLLSGGPPKDGIPALLNPHSVPVAEADFLKPDDRVVGVSLGGQDRAYPINILNWHELINDQLGGVPIGVIYCPLCDSVSVVDRRIGEQTLTFGVSGLLYNSNVVFYDRTHQSLWSQVGLTALSGPYAGQSLKHLAWELRPFGEWKKAHPQGTVVTFETGHVRDYRRNPYSSYFRTDALMFPVARSDDRLRPKTVVVGVKIGAAARAYPLERIAQAKCGRVMDSVAGHRVVLRVDPVTRGVVVEKIPPGAKVVHTFWFAWAAFHPDTDIYGSKPSAQGKTLPAEGAQRIPSVTDAGRSAPALEVDEWIAGQPTTLEKLKGKVVLLDFFQIICPGCRRVHPHILNMQEKYGDQGFQVVGLAVAFELQHMQTKRHIRDFVERTQFNYPVAVDKDFISTFRAYGAQGTPYVALIDRSGGLRYLGFYNPAEVERVVRTLLAQSSHQGEAKKDL
jgi:thiol-disulfide isomerase/thioredoxin